MKNQKPPTESQIYKKTLSTAIKVRGKIINETIYLERLIDEFLGRFFCSDPTRQAVLFDALLGTERITFENKRQIFQFVCERHYVQIKKENKDLFKDISTIIEHRNVLAHNLLNTTIDGYNKFISNKSISVIKFKNTYTVLEYSPRFVEELLELIAKCTFIIQEYLKKGITVSPQ